MMITKCHGDVRLGGHGEVADLVRRAVAILGAFTVAPEDTSLTHHEIKKLRSARKHLREALAELDCDS